MDEVARWIRVVARGRHGARDLEMSEAKQVFAHLLGRDADPLQLGAFLIAQRLKGESSAELAGFVQAARACITGHGVFQASEDCVDLPCYAGKRRASAVHLLAALRARDRGIGVVVHGLATIEGRASAWVFLRQAGVRRARQLKEGLRILQGEGIVFLALEDICPELARLIALRSRLGVRTCAHTVARLLNPMHCTGQLNGVFHAPYVARMTEANRLLGQPRSLVFMGAEGEPELYAERQKGMRYLADGRCWGLVYPSSDGGGYPRGARDMEALQRDFAEMSSGHYDERVRMVLERMREAFDLVAGRCWPASWKKEEV